MGSNSSDTSFLVTVVVGTRPEFIKMSPVIEAIETRNDTRLRLVHTGQHYDETLSATFFETFDLPTPDEYLGIGSGSHAKQTAEALVEIENDLVETDPDVVLAQGDTNAVVSAALATAKTDVRFGHVEAGIRSFDRSMPEEVNRVVADHLSDFRFVPTSTAIENLTSEGITEGVYATGNTVVDAYQTYYRDADRPTAVNEAFGVEPNDYVVATIHRPHNTDDRERLQTILAALDNHQAPVIFPVHPRTREAIERIGFEPGGTLEFHPPADYLDFLNVLANARLAVTDSGGVQEEAAVLEVPCLTVRPNTERPETVRAGVNELVEPASLFDRLQAVYESEYESMVGATTLYGDGTAGEQIVGVLQDELG